MHTKDRPRSSRWWSRCRSCGGGCREGRGGFNPWAGGQFVLTRLHARYTKDSLGEDLTFPAAPPIVGGRAIMAQGGKLEHGAHPSAQQLPGALRDPPRVGGP